MPARLTASHWPDAPAPIGWRAPRGAHAASRPLPARRADQSNLAPGARGLGAPKWHGTGARARGRWGRLARPLKCCWRAWRAGAVGGVRYCSHARISPKVALPRARGQLARPRGPSRAQQFNLIAPAGLGAGPPAKWRRPSPIGRPLSSGQANKTARQQIKRLAEPSKWIIWCAAWPGAHATRPPLERQDFIMLIKLVANLSWPTYLGPVGAQFAIRRARPGQRAH